MLRRRAALALAAGGVLAVSRVFWIWPSLAERLYAERVGPGIVGAMAAVSGRVGFSLAEGLIFAAAAFATLGGVRSLVGVLSGRKGPAEALARALSAVVAVGLVLAALFVVLWGIHYARPDLVSRLGWPKAEAPEPTELEGVCRSLVETTNRAYESATGSSDLGRPTSLPGDPSALERALDHGFAHLAVELGGPGAALSEPRGPAKPVWASVLLCHLGISGFYFPWTGEANYNRLVPACEIPHTLAHEKAHQRGIAREDEAHFVGFLACVESDEPFARYSGYLFAQRELLRELYRGDRAAYSRAAAGRHAGVARDVLAGVRFWGRYQGVAAAVGRGVNDAYLKAQGVREGIGSYSRSSVLLLAWLQRRGGSWEEASAAPVPGP